MAIVCSWSALIGFCSRTSMLLSAVSSLLLGSLVYSFAPAWSHRLNATLLAQLAFLFADCGDCMSIDRWIKRRETSSRSPPSGWPVLLAQWAVVLMFVNACGYKLMSGESFGWVFSDSLRNILLWRDDLHQEAVPTLCGG